MWVCMMDTDEEHETPETPGEETRKRSRLYDGLAIALIVGFLTIGALAFFEIPTLGFLAQPIAITLMGLAVALIGVVTLTTLVSMRRTLTLLARHEAELVAQKSRHAELAAELRDSREAGTAIRGHEEADFEPASPRHEDDLETEHGVPAPRAHRAGSPDLFENGQIHDVRDIETIGKHDGELLAEMGLADTQSLWSADPGEVAHEIKTTRSRVEAWQRMAELMTVPEIDETAADLLVQADVGSVAGLAAETPQKLLNRIQRVERRSSRSFQDRRVTLQSVQGWIQAAQRHYGVSVVNTDEPDAPTP